MQRRLLLGYLSLTLFVLLVLELPLGFSFARRRLQDLRSGVERDAVVIASFAEDLLEAGVRSPTASAGLEALAERYAADTDSRVVVVDQAGLQVVDTDPPAGGTRSFRRRPEIERALAGEVASGTRRSETLGSELLYVAVPVASGGQVHGAVRVTYPTAAIDRAVRGFWLTLAGVGAVSLGATAVVGVLLARWVARPLQDVQSAAVALGAGQLATRAPAGGPPEVRRLARAFNSMAGRLADLVSSQEAFVADASHQLRNPLAALRLRLENLEAEVDDEARDDLQGAVAEVQRLSRLVDGLLSLARADRAAGSTTTETTEVADLVEERREAWSALAEERQVTLRAETSNSGRFLARSTPDRLRQVLDNLLANALEVAPPGSAVTLRWVAAGERIEVHVVDEGPGMSAEQRARAFDRFWSGDPPRQDLGGWGLGLPIARKLVRADGGDLELRDAPAGGLDAVVTLSAQRGAAPASRGAPRLDP